MAQMLARIPAGTVAMGNVDPAGEFCHGTPESIRRATLQVMENCCPYPNFVISSGCDIPPMSKWENIDTFQLAPIAEMDGREPVCRLVMQDVHRSFSVSHLDTPCAPRRS